MNQERIHQRLMEQMRGAIGARDAYYRFAHLGHLNRHLWRAWFNYHRARIAEFRALQPGQWPRNLKDVPEWRAVEAARHYHTVLQA